MDPLRLLLAPLQALVPSTCAACGVPGPVCCRDCAAMLRPLPAPLCERCGHPLGVAAPRCAHCRGRVSGARAAVRYDGPAPALVASLKDRGRAGVAELLADLIVEATPPPPEGAVLVPIPLTRARLRRRGFNQSAVIARALGRRWARRVDTDLLVRSGADDSQRGASATLRQAQVRGVFALTTGRYAPHTVCLVDDVHTTGATLAAAAQALWLGGARTIPARCFARSTRRG